MCLTNLRHGQFKERANKNFDEFCLVCIKQILYILINISNIVNLISPYLLKLYLILRKNTRKRKMKMKINIPFFYHILFRN